MSYQSLAEVLQANNQIFWKRKVYSSFKDNVWVADLPDMQLVSEELVFYYLLLTFVVNTHGFFL